MNMSEISPGKSLRGRVAAFGRDWVRPLLVAGLVMGSFRSAVADWNDVPSGSMKPTLLEGDRIFVNRMAYDVRVPFVGWPLVHRGDPARGDIVVLWSPVDGRRLVKRAVAIPGDTVEVRGGHLFLNGVMAQYAPLGPEQLDRLAAVPLDRKTMALETVGERTHEVMSAVRGPAGRDFGPTVVPAGQYFLVGDHRDDSYDSRFWGFAARDAIIGRATAVVFSVDWPNVRPRWPRFMTALS
jgi:signal peptidase I